MRYLTHTHVISFSSSEKFEVPHATMQHVESRGVHFTHPINVIFYVVFRKQNLDQSQIFLFKMCPLWYY